MSPMFLPAYVELSTNRSQPLVDALKLPAPSKQRIVRLCAHTVRQLEVKVRRWLFIPLTINHTSQKTAVFGIRNRSDKAILSSLYRYELHNRRPRAMKGVKAHPYFHVRRAW